MLLPIDLTYFPIQKSRHICPFCMDESFSDKSALFSPHKFSILSMKSTSWCLILWHCGFLLLLGIVSCNATQLIGNGTASLPGRFCCTMDSMLAQAVHYWFIQLPFSIKFSPQKSVAEIECGCWKCSLPPPSIIPYWRLNDFLMFELTIMQVGHFGSWYEIPVCVHEERSSLSYLWSFICVCCDKFSYIFFEWPSHSHVKPFNRINNKLKTQFIA